jgi:hypothetical protein
MSDSVHQEEQLNQEEDFQGNSTDVYYIVNKYTGRAQGKIELHQIENLAIVQARIPEPDQITAQQQDALISPRNITIVPTAKKSLTGRQEEPTHDRFVIQRTINGIHCSVFGISVQELGEIIFAIQEGQIVFAKYINYYYKGGKEKGKYCQLMYFTQFGPSNSIPNWKFYCLGYEHIRFPSGTHSIYSDVHKINTVIYRISKVEIPPVETTTQVVENIKNSTTIE